MQYIPKKHTSIEHENKYVVPILLSTASYFDQYWKLWMCVIDDMKIKSVLICVINIFVILFISMYSAETLLLLYVSEGLTR